MFRGVARLAITATLLGLLSGCTTAPPSGRASEVPAFNPVWPAMVQPAIPDAPRTLSDPAPTLAPQGAAGDPNLLSGEAPKELERGGASWYGPGFHGRRTASGERFNMHDFTAAHRTLPFGTVVRIRSLVTGREVDVRINDRGPFSAGRVIDLSRAAAESLGMLGLGVKQVQLLVPESAAPVLTFSPGVRQAARPRIRPRRSPGRPQ
ncbi:septal ring lytic transglycosylase RlpA family protein [Polaromonas sp.]|uniref:septal ring lytic transglycosylase RlpA family protein n=1 Tax=Polaromonas sp. TaxID=1869339 RepID=UPI00286C825C|nr:septal ring lytic transglycosylase RlpA family protein [Polaromonas sp.]